jgi:hypothetical protein
MPDKQAFEDAREYQIAMEHNRRARNEAESVLVLQGEAEEAWRAFLQQEAGFFGRWMRRMIAR